MWFARRFSLFLLLVAPFATGGHAATSRCGGVAWIATFTPAPEINPTWSAVGSCILAVAVILRHSAKFQK
jgi:hypothetical protein